MKKELVFNVLMVFNMLILIACISTISMVLAATPISSKNLQQDDNPGICIPTWTASPIGTPYITPPPIGGGGVPTLTPPPIGSGSSMTPPPTLTPGEPPPSTATSVPSYTPSGDTGHR